jgi:hypothetical protein
VTDGTSSGCPVAVAFLFEPPPTDPDVKFSFIRLVFDVAPVSWTPDYGICPMEGRPLWVVQQSTPSRFVVML